MGVGLANRVCHFSVARVPGPVKPPHLVVSITTKPVPGSRPDHHSAFTSQLRCHWSFLLSMNSRPLCA